MFALIALIAFILALFHVHIGSVDLVILGLAFLALHFLFDYRPWGTWNRTPSRIDFSPTRIGQQRMRPAGLRTGGALFAVDHR